MFPMVYCQAVLSTMLFTISKFVFFHGRTSFCPQTTCFAGQSFFIVPCVIFLLHVQSLLTSFFQFVPIAIVNQFFIVVINIWVKQKRWCNIHGCKIVVVVVVGGSQRVLVVHLFFSFHSSIVQSGLHHHWSGQFQYSIAVLLGFPAYTNQFNDFQPKGVMWARHHDCVADQ